jgi:hypothetical protein
MHVHAHPYIPAQTIKMTRKVGKQQTRTKRPVRFDEAAAGLITVAYRLPDTNDKEDKGLWYDAVEMKTIRNSAMMLAEASRQHGLDKLLEGTTASTESNTEMPQDRHHVQAKLIHWSTHGHFHRGIEVLVNPLHGQSRAKLRRTAIHQVLLAQAKCRGSSSPLHPTLAEDYLAYVARYCSKSAVRFASMMGGADAFAAHREHQQQSSRSSSPPKPLASVLGPSSSSSSSSSSSTPNVDAAPVSGVTMAA